MKKENISVKKILWNCNDHIPYYHVIIKCETGKCCYMTTEFNMHHSDDIRELTLLILTYFSYTNDKIPKNWDDVQKEKNMPFGGSFINKNERFNREGEKNNWLFEYATDIEFLLEAGINKYCHSIVSVKVFYIDEKRDEYLCVLPNLGDIFDSEKEFIDYVRKLDDADLEEFNNYMKALVKKEKALSHGKETI